MRDSYSEQSRRNMAAVAGRDLPVWLVEIDHPDLAAPVRLVNDNADLTSNGETYVALAFKLKPPDDNSTSSVRAQLVVDNVGEELMQWLELSDGGRGATARLMQVRRGAPNAIEYDVTLELSGVEASALTVSAGLSFDELLNLSAIAVTYNAQTAPGIY